MATWYFQMMSANQNVESGHYLLNEKQMYRGHTNCDGSSSDDEDTYQRAQAFSQLMSLA